MFSLTQRHQGMQFELYLQWWHRAVEPSYQLCLWFPSLRNLPDPRIRKEGNGREKKTDHLWDIKWLWFYSFIHSSTVSTTLMCHALGWVWGYKDDSVSPRELIFLRRMQTLDPFALQSTESIHNSNIPTHVERAMQVQRQQHLSWPETIRWGLKSRDHFSRDETERTEARRPRKQVCLWNFTEFALPTASQSQIKYTYTVSHAEWFWRGLVFKKHRFSSKEAQLQTKRNFNDSQNRENSGYRCLLSTGALALPSVKAGTSGKNCSNKDD